MNDNVGKAKALRWYIDEVYKLLPSAFVLIVFHLKFEMCLKGKNRDTLRLIRKLKNKQTNVKFPHHIPQLNQLPGLSLGNPFLES